MLEFISFLILVSIPILIFGGIIWLARWLLKRFTGYDMGWDIEEAGHRVHTRDIDFMARRDWLNRIYGNSRRKKRSQSATPHYDRIVDQEWAEAQATERLSVQDQDESTLTAPEPIELGELLAEQRKKDQ